MKIKKHQLGGVAYTPYIRESGAGTTTSASPKSSKSEKDAGDEIQKAIIKVLLENKGLPNDVNYFLNKANALMMNSTDIYGNENYIMSDLIKLQSLANNIHHNQTAHTDAVTRLETENSGSEVAITNNGGLYVLDENQKLKTISINSYYENSDKYQLITQEDLLNLREHSPELIYNTSILHDLKSTVGLKTIVEYIQASIEKFGTHTNESKSVQYTEKEQGRIEQGFNDILGGVSPDGIYKVSTHSKISHQGYDSDTNEGLLEAAQYLWNTLNPQMKQTLRAQTVAEGLDPNNALDVYRTLIWAVQENTDHTHLYDLDVDYDSAATTAKRERESATSSEKTVPESWGHAVQMNYGTPMDTGMVLEGANIKYNFQSYSWGGVPEADGKTMLAYNTANETITNLQQQGIFNPNATAYFGDLPLTDSAANLIYVNNKGGRTMYLPVKDNNIDWNMLLKMGKMQDIIISRNVTDEQKIAQFWSDNGFDYDPNTKSAVPRGYTLGKYWVQQASVAASDDPYDESLLEDSKFITPMDNGDFENIEEFYNQQHKTNRDTIYPAGDAYQSMVFIPMNYNENESRVMGGMAVAEKVPSSHIAAQMDALSRSGGWNYNTGSPNHAIGYTRDSLN